MKIRFIILAITVIFAITSIGDMVGELREKIVLAFFATIALLLFSYLVFSEAHETSPHFSNPGAEFAQTGV